MSKIGRITAHNSKSIAFRRMKIARGWKPWDIYDFFFGLDQARLTGVENFVRRMRRSKNPGWLSRFFSSVWRSISPRARKEAQARIREEKRLTRELSSVSNQALGLKHLDQQLTKRRIQHKG